MAVAVCEEPYVNENRCDIMDCGGDSLGLVARGFMRFPLGFLGFGSVDQTERNRSTWETGVANLLPRHPQQILPQFHPPHPTQEHKKMI